MAVMRDRDGLLVQTESGKVFISLGNIARALSPALRRNQTLYLLWRGNNTSIPSTLCLGLRTLTNKGTSCTILVQLQGVTQYQAEQLAKQLGMSRDSATKTCKDQKIWCTTQ